MPDQIIGTRGSLLAWRDTTKFSRDLGFASTKEMGEFIKGSMFWPYFKEYAEKWIWPQQMQARGEGGVRGRSHTLETVEKHMIAGEDSGFDKFSDPFPDTKEWEAIDWQARLLLGLKNKNTRHAQGLFFGKELSESELHSRIWGLVKHAEKEQAPKRKRKDGTQGFVPPIDGRGGGLGMAGPAEGLGIAGLAAAHQPPAGSPASKPSAGPLAAKPPAGSPASKPPAGPPAPKPPAGPLAAKPPAGSPASKPPAGPPAPKPPAGPSAAKPPAGSSASFVVPANATVVDLVTPPVTPVIKQGASSDTDTKEQKEQTETIIHGDVTIKLEPRTDRLPRVLITNEMIDYHISDDESSDSGVDTLTTLTAGQRIMAEQRTPTANIKHRFWQMWACDKVTRKDTLREVPCVDYNQGSMTSTERESDNWRRELISHMDEDAIQSNQTDEEAMKAYNEQQAYCNSLAYQRENVQQSCTRLSINWQGLDDTIMRIRGMAVSKVLAIWQLVGIVAALRIREDYLTRGCILGDTVGLGKTWIALGFLLQHLHDRWQLPALMRRSAKPTLILVPPILINQWITEISQFAPGKFKIWLYYGDGRSGRENPIQGVESIDGRLTQKHTLFSGLESNCTSIVISSYPTWADRNGPKALKAWRVKNGMSKVAADRIEDWADPKWDGNLADKFSIVVCDEAHAIKSPSAKTSMAVKYLDADFHLLLTATLMPNGVDDFRGYAPLLESRSAKSWWEAESLQAMGIDKDVNPFELSDNHQGSKLRFTVQAMNDWIFHYRIPAVTKGLYLRQIFKQILIRRTNTSSIPFQNGKLIGDSIPSVRSLTLDCQFTDEESGEHEMLEDSLVGRLVVAGTETGTARKEKYSLRTHRKLQILSMSTNLLKLDNQFDLKADKMKALFQNPSFHLQWLNFLYPDEQHVAIRPHNPVSQLEKLLYGAPKLRAFIKKIRDSTVRDGEKNLVFFAQSVSMALAYAVIKLLGIDVAVLAAWQTPVERAVIMKEFNERDKLKILLSVYAVGGIGLNFQKKCYRVHALETSYSEDMTLQVIGRSRRYGNPSSVVWFYEYWIGGTFDSKAIARNIAKAIPNTMATLNREIFYGQEANEDTIDLGNWVIEDGRLIRYEMAKNPHQILGPKELITTIIKMGKGEQLVV